MALTINQKRSVAWSTCLPRDVSNLKQSITCLSCFSPLPVLQGAALAQVPGHHQLHAVFTTALTWHALFLIAVKSQRETWPLHCAAEVAHSHLIMWLLWNIEVSMETKKGSQRKNFCLLCCSHERQCCDIMALTAKTTAGLTSKYVF